jgi:hypothetical protein
MHYKLRNREKLLRTIPVIETKSRISSSRPSNHKFKQANFDSELKFQITKRLRFYRRSCKRFFKIEINNNLALRLKAQYNLTFCFNENEFFCNDYNIYSFRNFFSEKKYWEIAGKSFQIRISKKRKVKSYPDSYLKAEIIRSPLNIFSVRFMVKTNL